MAGYFHLVIVRFGHDCMHLFEGHAERMMIVRIGSGSVARRIGFHPFDSIFDQLPNGATAVIGPIDDENQPLHADLAEVRVPIHQPAGPTDLAPTGRQAWADNEILLERLLQPDIDVVQTTAAASCRIAALKCELRVGRREQRDIFDRVFDIEVLELGHVEIGGVIMRFYQAWKNRSSPRIDVKRCRRKVGCGIGWTGVMDLAVFDDQHGVVHRRPAIAVDHLSIADGRSPSCGLHRREAFTNAGFGNSACKRSDMQAGRKGPAYRLSLLPTVLFSGRNLAGSPRRRVAGKERMPMKKSWLWIGLVLVVLILVMTPEHAWAAPGGKIVSGIFKTTWGKVLLAVVVVVLSPVIAYVMIKERIAEKKTIGHLRRLAAIDPNFDWMTLKDRVTDCYHR